MDLPADVSERIGIVFPNGREWLQGVELLFRDLATGWSLVFDGVPVGNYSFVLPAGDFMLKLLPQGEDFDRQLTAMLAWDGHGAARVEKYDSERRAMLLERCRPGTELTALYHQGRDEEATKIACGLMGRLAIPLPSLGGAGGGLAIPTVAERAAELSQLRTRFKGGTGPFPAHLVDAAEGLFSDLVASQGEACLIHADLHHENILESERGWLAIDPHGLIAEREFETYAWLNNPIGLSKNPDLKAISRRRLDQISDLTGFDRERIRGWGIACAVLSAWWSFEDHGSAYEADLAVAGVLPSI